MTNNYFILYLRLSTLVRLYRKNRNQFIGAVSYIDITRPASLLLKWMNRFHCFSFSFHRVKQRSGPAGPVLNLCNVRNDRGEVISRDIYHHILAVRREIWDRILDIYRSFHFIKSQKLLSPLAAYIGLVIAEEVKTALYISHYARWKEFNEAEDNNEALKNIMIIPRFMWNDILIPHLLQNVDEVIVENAVGKGWRWPLLRFKRLLIAMKTVGWKDAFRFFRKPESIDFEQVEAQHQNNKLMVVYGMGVIADQRNDIPFLHAAGISPSRLAVYFRFDHLIPSQKDKKWLNGNQVACFTPSGRSQLAQAAGAIQWSPSQQYQHCLRHAYKHYLSFIAQSRNSKNEYHRWMKDTLWEMGSQVALWQDFFKQNQISIVVNQNPSIDNFIPNLAISQLGGLVIEFERSLRFDYCTYIHNAFSHTNFITGPYSLTQIPEASFSCNTVQSGGINTDMVKENIHGIETLRKNAKWIVALFDEIPNDVFFGDSVRQCYEALIRLASEDERFGILIKTKKEQILERFEEIQDSIRTLEKKGRCLIAGWQEKVSTAAANSDIVVTMPSTAAFESAMMGIKTIVFNPMRVGSSLFYTNNGLNRRIVEDGEILIEVLKKYADTNDQTIGDCHDIADYIDPFRDNFGAKRIGDYLSFCLNQLDSGKKTDSILIHARENYTHTWGNDKITTENAYETTHPAN